MSLYPSISNDHKQKVIKALCAGDIQTLKTINVYEYNIDEDKLFRAIFKGFHHVHLVEYMLEHQWKDIVENCNFWAIHAVKQHPLHIIEQLGQYSTEPLNEALVAAVRCNRADVVAVVGALLPYCDPTALNSKALQYASVNHNLELFDLLYEVSDPGAALESLQKISTNPVDWMMLHERMEAERINDVLRHNVEAGARALQRKM